MFVFFYLVCRDSRREHGRDLRHLRAHKLGHSAAKDEEQHTQQHSHRHTLPPHKRHRPVHAIVHKPLQCQNKAHLIKVEKY